MKSFFYRILAYILRPTNLDKLYLRVSFYREMGYKLDLKNPQTFCEKLQWLKLYDRKPHYTNMVDKYEVKKYVSCIIGSTYIIPTLGLWEDPCDIEWDSLPNEFVLKTTSGGGNNGVVICKNKTTLNKDLSILKLQQSSNQSLYRIHREWPYKNIKTRFIAEEYLSDGNENDLVDYKFYCFNGDPKYCQVIRDRNSKETIDFYDMDWNLMPFVGLNPNVENGNIPVPKPVILKEMISICKKLSVGIPFLRVDLYLVYGKIYFGEMTFYPGSGYGRFTPPEWNRILGDLITLPVV